MSGRGRPMIPLSLKEGEEEELRSIAGSPHCPTVRCSVRKSFRAVLKESPKG